MSAVACLAKKIRIRRDNALRSSHPHRQLPQRPPAGLRGRRAALGSGPDRPRAEGVRRAFTSRWDSPACCGRSTPSPGARPCTRAGRRPPPRSSGTPSRRAGRSPRTAAWNARRECRAAAGLAADAVGPCAELRGLERFGDASPDLIYCAEALIYAFPDARIVQVIRDGRDVVASMLADPVVMSWFRPSFVNVDTEFPNPFFGIETEDDRETWPRAVARRPVRAALALVRPPGREAAPQPAGRPAEDAPLRGPAEQARRGRGRAVPISPGPRCRRPRSATRPAHPGSADGPAPGRGPRSARRSPPRSTSSPARNSAASAIRLAGADRRS